MHHTAGDWATDGPTFQNVLNWMYNIDDLADGNWGNCGNVLGKQHVTSFFVTEKGLTKAQEYANAGGTVSPTTWDYNDVDAMVSKLKSVMAQILSVSTTFTAASVPVSVLNRSQIVDNVYIALFRTDENDLARWPGNIKKLKLDSSGTILNDANDTPAIASDGRIKYDALTFWTDDTTLPTPDPNKNEVAGKDGRSVARGGAGQKIPGFTTGDPGLANSVSGARQLYYEPSSGNTLVALDADDTTKITATEESDLGASTTSEAQDLIKFARGYDMTDDDKDKVYLEARSWILGDSLHSRPLPINYGNSDSSKDPDIRLLMGTNDGFMHMFKNTDPGTTGTQLGTEVWAYMPRAVMGVVKTLKSDLAGTHPYGVDGPPAAYLYDKGLDGVIKSSDGDKVWLYFGLRRGGKAYYGLDISAPDAPTKLWTITNTGDFSELGLSFSQPRVEDLDWGSGTKPVVLFGGGYDTNKDTRTVDATSGKPTNQAALGTDDTVGNAIYIVDAQTGALVWKATQGTSATASYDSSKLTYFLAKTDMTDSIPSTLTTLDTDNDGLVDRAYVGDTGGNIWRVDMGDKDRSNWTVVKLANLGRHFNNTAKTDIRFFHRPDFVQYKDGTGAYDAVIVGSGDRANPLDTTRENWMFMIKDRFTTSGTPPTSVINFDDLADVTSSTVYNCLKTSCATAPDLAYGWKLQLESSGEKALATPTTISSQVYFTTYVPADIAAIKAKNSCDPSEGSGRLYAVSLAKAFAVNDYSVDNGTTKGKEDRYVDLKSGGIPAEVVYIPFNKILKPDLTVQNVNTTARWKSYWYPSEK
jgi:type IV pilus assembly protein PilY1